MHAKARLIRRFHDLSAQLVATPAAAAVGVEVICHNDLSPCNFVFRADVPAGPKIVYSNEMATELVQLLPGSIAFVSAAQVPSTLKILRVDGRLPGEKGYPLH